MRPQSAPAIRIHEHGLSLQTTRRASNDPRIHLGHARPRPRHRYALAVVVADFIATDEAFQRALIGMARASAAQIGLCHQPGKRLDHGAQEDPCCDAILLEGLRWRLGLREDECTIVTGCPVPAAQGETLIVCGHTAASLPASGLHPISQTHGLQCDLVIMQEGPDWDSDHWGDATT